MIKLTAVSAVIIFVVLLFVYRSIVTVLGLLFTVGIELLTARGVVAFLADQNLIGLSIFATSLLVALAMAAGTDYGIFFFGRYQELRQSGEEPENAYYGTYRSVAPVVLGSGLTIAGAMLCLSFTRCPSSNRWACHPPSQCSSRFSSHSPWCRRSSLLAAE